MRLNNKFGDDISRMFQLIPVIQVEKPNFGIMIYKDILLRPFLYFY